MTELAVISPDVVVIEVGMPGPAGAPGAMGSAGSTALTVTAGEALGGHRLVVLDGGAAFYAGSDISHHAWRVAGLTLGAALPGAPVDVLRAGEVFEPTWSWDPLLPVFLSTNGQLTQVPPSVGISLIVGFPVAPTKLFLSLREPITLF